MRRRRKWQQPARDYTYEELRDEREYGFYWYHWLWQVVRPVSVVLCSLLLCTGILYSAWSMIEERFFAPVDAENNTAVTFQVKSGSSLTKVSNQLEAAGLVRNRTVFKYYADFLGFGQKIQAGTYQLTPAMTMRQIAEQLATGDGVPLVRKITLIEGWTVEDIAAYLVKEGVLKDSGNFLNLCRTGEDYASYYYIADVLQTDDVSERHYALEGYLAPDTYEIYTSATEDDIIRKLLSQTEAVFEETWHDRMEELDMTMDEVITLASLIEKEAKTEDFKHVSAVFHNRLKKNMTLGSDVSVKYASGITRMVLSSDDLAVNSKYNTYVYKGLPLGPVCNPSAAAIEAALYPDEDYGEYLYFCSKDPDTGELYFSKTLEEHEAACKIYAPLWQAYDERTEAK